MTDLTLRAANRTSLMSQLKSVDRKLTRLDDDGVDQFINAGHSPYFFRLIILGPVTLVYEVRDENDVVTTPAVIDTRFHAILRAEQAVTDAILALNGNPNLVLEGAEEAAVLAVRGLT